jgi:hypothetical protein
MWKEPLPLRIHARLSFALAFAGLSCSHATNPPEPGARPDANPVTGPTMVRTSSDASPSPEAPAYCAVGTGDPRASCDRGGAAALWADVDAAIDEVVLKSPQLFNLKRVVGQKGFYVLAHDELYLRVAAALQAKGLCAQYDYRVLHVKNGPSSSEQYELIFPNGHLRRDPGTLTATCTPASFPLDPADVIDRVRVAFYSIQCEDGRTPPRNGEGVLPSDCTGFVTATPKKADDTDVHRSVHGPDILWELEQTGHQVAVEDFPNVTFNKLVHGRDTGTFRLCATVQTHRGCLDGEVVP